MGVSSVDGVLEEAVPGRRAAGLQIFKKLVFRLDGGGTKTVAKAVVHSDLVEHMQPGLRGRFYLFTAIDHRGLHGFRTADGMEMHRFPKNNERIAYVLLIVCAIWVSLALVLFGGVPILPTILLIIGIPLTILTRKTRIESEQQFAADNAAPAGLPA